MADENEDCQPNESSVYTSDRFIPSRDGGSMNSVYSVVDEVRAQSNQSPEINKGMYV